MTPTPTLVPNFDPFSLPTEHALYGEERLLTHLADILYSPELGALGPLNASGIYFVYEFLERSVAELLQCPHLSTKSLRQTQATIAASLKQDVPFGCLAVAGKAPSTSTPTPQFDPCALPHDNCLFGNMRLIANIREIGLSTRSFNALNVEKIYFVYEILQRTEPELLKIPNIGRGSLHEIQEVISRHIEEKIKFGRSPIIPTSGMRASGENLAVIRDGKLCASANVVFNHDYTLVTGLPVHQSIAAIQAELGKLNPRFNERASALTRHFVKRRLDTTTGEDADFSEDMRRSGQVFNIPIELDVRASSVVTPRMFTCVVTSRAFHDAVREITQAHFQPQIDDRIRKLEALKTKAGIEPTA